MARGHSETQDLISEFEFIQDQPLPLGVKLTKKQKEHRLLLLLEFLGAYNVTRDMAICNLVKLNTDLRAVEKELGTSPLNLVTRNAAGTLIKHPLYVIKMELTTKIESIFRGLGLNNVNNTSTVLRSNRKQFLELLFESQGKKLIQKPKPKIEEVQDITIDDLEDWSEIDEQLADEL